jgi:hypothetical protein
MPSTCISNCPKPIPYVSSSTLQTCSTCIVMRKHLTRNRRRRRRSRGTITHRRFARRLYTNMTYRTAKWNKSRLNPSVPVAMFTFEAFSKFLFSVDTYIVETSCGTMYFPMVFTNGFYNTASPDRIRDNSVVHPSKQEHSALEGDDGVCTAYSLDNLQIRPTFMNSPYALKDDDFRSLTRSRNIPQSLDQLNYVATVINDSSCDTHSPGFGFFCKLASHAKFNTKAKKGSRKIMYHLHDRPSIAAKDLLRMYIEQGGRCAYTNVPIIPHTSARCFKISLERIDPCGHYELSNLVLIAAGFNTRPPGQYSSADLSDQEKREAMLFGCWNQTYWDRCTLVDRITREKMFTSKAHDQKILERLVTRSHRGMVDHGSRRSQALEYGTRWSSFHLARCSVYACAFANRRCFASIAT